MAGHKEFIWEKEDHSPKGFIHRFKDKLPLIVKVTQGYCGIDDDDKYNYPAGDIYRLSKVKEQCRAIFRDDQNQLFSIPVSYPIRFQIVQDGKEGPLKFLHELQEELKVGKKVKVEDTSFTIGIHDEELNREKKVKLGLMEFEALHTESYIVGNCILDANEDWVTIVIPHYADTRLAMASGVKGGTTKDFDKARAEIAWTCGKYSVSNDHALGNQEIMLIDGDPDDLEDYENIKPKQYVRPEQVNRSEDYILKKPDLASQLRSSPLYKQRTDSSTKKDTLHPGATGQHVNQRQASPRRPVPSIPAQHTYSKAPEKRRPPKPPPRRMNYEKKEENQDDLKWPPPPPPEMLQNIPDDYEVPNPGWLNTIKNKPSQTPKSPDPEYVNSKGIATAICKPQMKEGQKEEKEEKDEDDYVEMKNLKITTPHEIKRNATKSNKEITPAKVPITFPEPTVIQDQHELKEQPTTVPPMEYQKCESSIQSHEPKVTGQRKNSCKYASLEEVPKTLSGLSVNEVATCLKLLNLDKYVPMFLSEHVDGSLLSDLDKDMLVNDFKFSAFEAIKFHKFVHKGWRPKRDS